MSHLPTPPAGLLTAFTYAVHLARAALVLAALRAMRPLLGPTDDISDIPLTPRQRSLLGLRPVRESPSLSQPSTPGSAASSMPGSPAVGYVTPPRFVRASSAAGAFASAGASSRAATLGSSPPTPGRSPSSAGGGRSGAGSPAGFGPGGSLLRGPARNDFALSPIPSPNPLVRRAMAAKRWSLGGGGLGDSGAAPGSPSPAPTGGNGGSGSRTPSVTLSNKWLYQRQWSGNGPARHI
jgi:nucleoporin POM34